MAHVTLTDDRKGVIPRLGRAYTRKRFGRSVQPAQAAAHHSGVLVAMGALETAAEMGWKKLDPELRWLAIQAVAGQIRCTWCIDYAYYDWMHAGFDPRKVRAAAAWRESTLFDERERAVLEYAEGASATPAAVSDECAQRLHEQFDEAEMVELAAWVALENFRSRFNAGLGLHSQGFADECEIPMSMQPPRAAS